MAPIKSAPKYFYLYAPFVRFYVKSFSLKTGVLSNTAAKKNAGVFEAVPDDELKAMMAALGPIEKQPATFEEFKAANPTYKWER